MTKIKKIFIIGLVILSLSAISVTSFAATEYKNPAEVYSALTETPVEDALALRQTSGITFGQLALEAGKSDDFKALVFEMKKQILADKVEAGVITQEKADEVLAILEAHIADCDGTGFEGAKAGIGIGFGTGTMQKQGNSLSRGGQGGMQRGSGQRQNLKNGSCLGN